MTQDPSPRSRPGQSQDVQIGHDLRVEGTGHQVDFSQTHIETQIIHLTAEQIQTQPLNLDSPYKSLNRFEAADKDYFFGRQDWINTLESALNNHTLILLLGASGSGKSSVIRAGLIPQIHSHFHPLIFVPNRNPFEALYSALVSQDIDQSQAELARVINPETLIHLVQQLKPARTQWLIFIDQFEEIFTLTETDKRDAFIEGLVRLYRCLEKQSDRSVKILLTMRTDFLERFSDYPRLNAITQQNIRNLTNLEDDQLRQAIEQPAAKHGVAFEGGLVQEIIDDLRGQPGALPLLEYTLDLLWQKERERDQLQNRTLYRDTYHALGGVRGALQKHVDAIYNSLDPAAQEAVKRIFLKLVDITGAVREPNILSRAVSRPVSLSEFHDPVVVPVLRRLINEKLLVSGRTTVLVPSASTTPSLGHMQPSDSVEIAHETLLSSWDTLRQWIEDSKEVIGLKRRLEEDSRRWDDLCRSQPLIAENELWRGQNLQRVRTLDADNLFDLWLGGLDPVERQFINASQSLSDRLQHEKELQQKRELRLYRGIASGAIAALALISAVSAFAIYQWRAADQGQIEALITSADAKFEANPDSLDTLQESLMAGRQLQKSIWFRGDRTLQARVLKVLTQAVYWGREVNRWQAHGAPVTTVSFSPEGNLIATGGRDHQAHLWNQDGQKQNELRGHTGAIFDISFSPEGQKIATASFDKTIKLWTREGTEIPGGDLPHTGEVFSVAFGANTLLASGTVDGSVYLWSLLAGKHDSPAISIRAAHEGYVWDIAFRPNQHSNAMQFATAGQDGRIKLWNTQGKLLKTLSEHRDQVSSVAFNRNGSLLASTSFDGTVKIWDENGNRLRTLQSQGALTGVCFTPDNSVVASNQDGTIQVWNATGDAIAPLKGHTNRVNGISLSPDGNLLASAGSDLIVRLWRLNRPLLTVLPSPSRAAITSVQFSPDQKWLLTTDAQGRIRLWDAKTNRLAREFPRQKTSIATAHFNPASTQIVTGGFDGKAILWTIDGQVMQTFPADPRAVYAVRFSPNGQQIATGGSDRQVKLWALNGTLHRTLPGHTNEIRALSFSPTGALLASASDDGTVILWDEAGQQQSILKSHTAGVTDVSFNQTGSELVTASRDNTIKRWDISGRLIRTFEEQSATVNAVIFGSDSQTIYSAGESGIVQKWTLDGTLINTFSGYGAIIYGISLDSQAKQLAVGGEANQVLIWKEIDKITVEQLLQIGCDRLKHYTQCP